MRDASVILFDLDDTIVDFTGSVAHCWRAALETASLRHGGFEVVPAQAAVTRTADEYWSDPTRHLEGRRDLRAASAGIVQQALTELGVVITAVEARAISDDYRDRRDAGLTLFEGALDALERLRSRGLRLGLVTNGSAADQRAKIERFGLAPYFEHVQIEGEFGLGKPEPGVYTHALQSLRVAPEATWFVGDHLEWDVAAPQRAGMRGAWVDGTGAGPPTGSTVVPDRTLRALRELL